MKRKLISMLAVVCILASSMTCFAASSTVPKKFIDSNSWTSITSAKKDATTAKASILVSTMYDANGVTASNYKLLKVRLGSSGGQGSEVTATKGTTCDISININYQAKGTTLNFYGMGNNPALDCYIYATCNAN